MINKNPIIEMLAKKSKVTSENFEFGYNSVTEEVGIFADNNKSFHNAFVGGKENLFLKSGKFKAEKFNLPLGFVHFISLNSLYEQDCEKMYAMVPRTNILQSVQIKRLTQLTLNDEFYYVGKFNNKYGAIMKGFRVGDYFADGPISSLIPGDLDFLSFTAIHLDDVAFISCEVLLAPGSFLVKHHQLSELVEIIPESEYKNAEVFFSSNQQVAQVDTPLSFNKIKRTPATDYSGATDDELQTVQKQPPAYLDVLTVVPKKPKMQEKKAEIKSAGIAIQMTPPNLPNEVENLDDQLPDNSSDSLATTKINEKELPLMNSPSNDAKQIVLPSSFYCHISSKGIYTTCFIPGIDLARNRPHVNNFLTNHPLITQQHNKRTRDANYLDIDSPQNELHKQGKTIFNDYWGGMRDNLSWKCIWVKDGMGGNIDSYTPPFAPVKADDLIQNLEYFEKDSFFVHMVQNPVLTQEWKCLWPQLQMHGWETKEMYITKHGRAVSGDYFSPKSKNISQNNIVSRQYVYTIVTDTDRVPGVHVFTSKLALSQYIARYPYLLQDDETFHHTLEQHGWKLAGKSKVYALNGSVLSFSKIKELFWRQPQMLFYHYFGHSHDSDFQLTERDIINAIMLPAEAALAEDREPYSPVIDGMTYAQRDKKLAKINSIVNTIKVIMAQKRTLKLSALRNCVARLAFQYPPSMDISVELIEETEGSEERKDFRTALENAKKLITDLYELLEEFTWQYTNLSWHPTWLKYQPAIVAPYAPKDGSKWIYGVHYFFSFLELVEAIAIDSDVLISLPLKGSILFTREYRNGLVDYFSQSAEQRIQWVFHNFECSEINFDYVRNVLSYADNVTNNVGWEIFQNSKGKWIYVTPHGIENGVTVDNYTKHKYTIDYFLENSDLKEYLGSSITQDIEEMSVVSKDSVAIVDPEIMKVEVKEKLKPSSKKSKKHKEQTIDDRLSELQHKFDMQIITSPVRDIQEFLIHRESKKGYYKFSLVAPLLKELQWKNCYVKGSIGDYLTYILPPWTYDKFVKAGLIEVKAKYSYISQIPSDYKDDKDHLYYNVTDERDKIIFLDSLKTIDWEQNFPWSPERSHKKSKDMVPMNLNPSMEESVEANKKSKELKRLLTNTRKSPSSEDMYFQEEEYVIQGRSPSRPLYKAQHQSELQSRLISSNHSTPSRHSSMEATSSPETEETIHDIMEQAIKDDQEELKSDVNHFKEKMKEFVSSKEHEETYSVIKNPFIFEVKPSEDDEEYAPLLKTSCVMKLPNTNSPDDEADDEVLEEEEEEEDEEPLVTSKMNVVNEFPEGSYKPLVDLLKNKEKFSYVFNILKEPFHWFYIYSSKSMSGNIYFRPGRDPKNIQNLVLNEDYFYEQNDVIEFLCKKCRIKDKKGRRSATSSPSSSSSTLKRSESLPASRSSKPLTAVNRSTSLVEKNRMLHNIAVSNKRKHVTQYDSSPATSPSSVSSKRAKKQNKKENLSTHEESKVAAMDVDSPEKPVLMEETAALVPESMLSPDHTISEFTFPEKLGPCVDAVSRYLKSYSSQEKIEQFPLPGREKECEEMLSQVLYRLREGCGGIIYATGATGSGKTLSIDSVLYALQHKVFGNAQYDLGSYPGKIFHTIATHIEDVGQFYGLLHHDNISEPIRDKAEQDRLDELFQKAATPLSDIPRFAFERNMTPPEKEPEDSQDFEYSIYDILVNGSPSKPLISEVSVDSDFNIHFHKKKGGKAGKGKQSSRAMTILVIHEIDTLKEPILNKLLDLTIRAEESNVLVLSSGNRREFFESMKRTALHPPITVTYPVYTTTMMQTLIQQRVGPLMDERTAEVVSKRFQNGDIRNLFDATKSALFKARSEMEGKDANWRDQNASAIIKFTHVPQTDNKERIEKIQYLDALSPLHRLLIVALMIEGQTQHSTFTARDALDSYNNYAATHLPMKPVDDIQNILQALLGYNLIKMMKENANPAMRLYQLKVTKDDLMKLNNIGSTQKAELEHHFRMNMTQDC